MTVPDGLVACLQCIRGNQSCRPAWARHTATVSLKRARDITSCQVPNPFGILGLLDAMHPQ